MFKRTVQINSRQKTPTIVNSTRPQAKPLGGDAKSRVFRDRLVRRLIDFEYFSVV